MEEFEPMRKKTAEQEAPPEMTLEQRRHELKELRREIIRLITLHEEKEPPRGENPYERIREALPAYDDLLEGKTPTQHQKADLLMRATWRLSDSIAQAASPLPLRFVYREFLKKAAALIKVERSSVPKPRAKQASYYDQSLQFISSYILAKSVSEIEAAPHIGALCQQIDFYARLAGSGDEKASLALEAVRTIYRRGTPEQKGDLDDYIIYCYSHNRKENPGLAKLTELFFSSKKINPHESMSHWILSGPREELGLVVFCNMQAMRFLEEFAPGSCHELQTRFGIHHFHRYPPEILLKQYETRDDLEKAYILLLGVDDDNNGAFYQDNAYDALNDLARQLKDKALLRIVEVSSPKEACERLAQLDATYHPTQDTGHRIAHVIVYAHGDTDSLSVNSNNQKHFFSATLVTEAFQKTQRYFEDKATFIFNSCKIGRRRRFAQRLSRAYSGRKIVAATRISSIRRYRVRFSKRGQISLDADYDQGPYIKNVFQDGKQIA